MSPPVGTAGTAGRGFRSDDQPHTYAAARVDPGERARCTCGRERHEHTDERRQA